MAKNNNDTRSCDHHDWTDSLVESGVQVCAWPKCSAKREAPVAPAAGVDFPVSGPVAEAVRRAA